MNEFGRYQIVGELGRGAMGVVYRAEDPAIGRTLAIKTIRLARITEIGGGDERMRELWLREAQSAGILHHPGIVTIYDVQQDETNAYVLMEFVNGRTLESILRERKTLDKQMIVTVLMQTASALDYAHSKGVVHRDIKPANIMIDADSQVKITDFGVAKITSKTSTPTGIIMGTPGYLAPEYVQGERKIDGRADQFALAVLAYELLCGRRPFVGSDVPSLLFQIVRAEPPPMQSLNPTMPHTADIVMRKALAKAADDRYPNCEAWIKALRGSLDSRPNWEPVGIDATPATLPPTPSMPSTPATPPMATTIQPKSQIVMAPPPPAPVAPPVTYATRRPEPPAEPPKERAMPPWVIGVSIGVVAAAITLGFLEGWFTRKSTALSVQPTPTPTVAPTATPPPGKRRPTPTPTPTGSPRSTPTPTPSAVEPTGSEVTVTTSPAGARLVFDNDESTACTSPCGATLKPGRHALAATSEGFRRAFRIFNVPQESGLTVAMERTAGILIVLSNPPGAAIAIDGQGRPEVTPARISLPAGHHKIRLSKDGVPPYEQDIDVPDNIETTMNVNWSR